MQGDLTKPETLEPAFTGARGAFLVTNFWDPATATSETAQGTLAVKAAKAAGVQHLVWSTLPNCEEISGGKYEVIHFTGKARVDAEVTAAGVPYYTFVEAPMYFQNFIGMMPPQPLGDGRTGWTIAMSPDSKGCGGTITNNSRSGDSFLGRDNQDVELTGFQTKGPQRVIIQVGDHSIKQA